MPIGLAAGRNLRPPLAMAPLPLAPNPPPRAGWAGATGQKTIDAYVTEIRS